MLSRLRDSLELSLRDLGMMSVPGTVTPDVSPDVSVGPVVGELG